MDFGQHRLKQQQSAREMMYQNSGYQFERRDKKTLIVDVADQGTATTNPLTNATDFSLELFEPLIIDKLADVYLDSFLTHNSSVAHTGDKMAFSLKINEFNVDSNVAYHKKTGADNGQGVVNRILIPNEHTSILNVNSCVVHKGKKMNYICSINPCKLSKITGRVTDLAGNSMWTEGTTTTTASSVLHYIEITPTSAAVTIGTTFTWAAGVTNAQSMTTAFAMAKGATSVYFHGAGTSVIGASGPSGAITAAGTGLNTVTGVAGTYRAGDNSRFLAEFVIVARE